MERALRSGRYGGEGPDGARGAVGSSLGPTGEAAIGSVNVPYSMPSGAPPPARGPVHRQPGEVGQGGRREEIRKGGAALRGLLREPVRCPCRAGRRVGCPITCAASRGGLWKWRSGRGRGPGFHGYRNAFGNPGRGRSDRAAGRAPSGAQACRSLRSGGPGLRKSSCLPPLAAPARSAVYSSHGPEPNRADPSGDPTRSPGRPYRTGRASGEPFPLRKK